MNSRFHRMVASVSLMLALMGAPSWAQSGATRSALQTAQGGSGAAQYTAIDDLGERHEAPSLVVPVLQELLASQDKQVRWRSARALGDYGLSAKGAAGELRGLLEDSDPIVRYHAAVALGRIGDTSEETTGALVAAARSKDARVARAAIGALRSLRPGPKRVAEALAAALESDDDAVNLYAMEAIVAGGAEAAPLLNEALQRPQTAYLACAAIEQIGPDAAATVPALAELLGKTKHSQLLVQALLALASIGPEAHSAAPAIMPHLEHPEDASVSAAAAYALGSIGVKDADDELRAALAKDSPLFQMVAAWALAKIHPEDKEAMKLAVDKLAAGLGNSSADIRTAAARSLETLGAPPEMVAPALLKVANDPDPDVEANVVRALAGLGERIVPRATEALKAAEKRDLAIKVLTALGAKASGAVPALVDALQGADAETAIKINLALAAIGSPAAEATAALAEALSSPNEGVRESALLALRRIGPGAKGAVDALVETLGSEDSFDAAASAWALAAIAPDDKEAAAQSLPVLVEGLKNEDARVRLESAEALAAWGGAAGSAADALKDASEHDGNADVRSAAASALERVSSGQ